jgi:hypothetical protein
MPTAQITGMNPKASFGLLYPPLRGIVQLTNSAALRLRNWSFTNKEERHLVMPLFILEYIINRTNTFPFNTPYLSGLMPYLHKNLGHRRTV